MADAWYLPFDGVNDVITTGVVVGGSFDDRENTSADWTLDIDWSLDDSGVHRFFDRSNGSDAALIRASDGLVRFNLRVSQIQWFLGSGVIPVATRFTLRLQKVPSPSVYRLFIDGLQVGGDMPTTIITQFNWDVFGKDGSTGDRFDGDLYQIIYTANAFAGDSLHLKNSVGATETIFEDISGGANNATLTGFTSPPPWFLYDDGGGGDGFTITPETGAYTYTGGAVNILASRTIAPQQAEYAYTGGNVNQLYGRVVQPEQATYTYTGGNTTLLYARSLTPQTAVYNYTGGDVTLTASTITNVTLTPETASFSYVGGDVTLTRDLQLATESGVYAYSGGDITLVYTPVGAIVLTLESGVFTYDGGAVGFAYDRVMQAESGVFDYTGGDVTALYGRSIPLDDGVFTYQGGAIDNRYNRLMTPETGSYLYNGGAVDLNYSGLIIRRISRYTVTYANDSINIRFSEDSINGSFQ